MNMFPSKIGISNNLIPEEIILGYLNPDHSKLIITFGAYVQVHIGTNNNTEQITMG